MYFPSNLKSCRPDGGRRKISVSGRYLEEGGTSETLSLPIQRRHGAVRSEATQRVTSLITFICIYYNEAREEPSSGIERVR